MSNWITDRRPTAEEAHDLGQVWVTTEHGIVLRQLWNQIGDRPWMPVARPEPYVKPKRYKVYNSITGSSVFDTFARLYVASNIVNREAAERIAAIYEEVMP